MILLVVDDSFATRRLIVNELRMSGLKAECILEAGDGLEALAVLERATPDVVICDYHMPKLDGIKFVTMLRQRFSADRVKVILLTARGSVSLEKAAREAGVDHVLDKPFDVHSLLEQIVRLGREETAEINPQFTEISTPPQS